MEQTDQTNIEGIESSSSTAVGVTVTTSTPVTRQITNTNVDAVKVTITFPQIQKATDEGDLLGSTVSLKICKFNIILVVLLMLFLTLLQVELLMLIKKITE